MFENYFLDADRELNEAVFLRDRNDNKTASAKLRLVILTSVCALESYINFVTDTLNNANKLEGDEYYYLNEIRLIYNNNRIERVTDYKPLEDKLKILIIKADDNYDFGASTHWQAFKELKKLLDILTHPPEEFEEPPFDEYLSVAKNGLSATINIVNYLNKAFFSRSIRLTLLEIDPAK